MCISLQKATKNVQKRTVIAETVPSFLERRASATQVWLKPNYLFSGACSANVFVSHVHKSLRDLAAPYSDCVKEKGSDAPLTPVTNPFGAVGGKSYFIHETDMVVSLLTISFVAT